MNRNAITSSMLGLTLALFAGVAAAEPAPASQPAANVALPVDAATYVPQFTIAKSAGGHDWILDHGQKVALFQGSMISLFRQFPGQPIDEAKVLAAESAGHWYLLPGLRLWAQFMMTADIGPTWYLHGVAREMSQDLSDPSRLIINQSWKKSADEFGTEMLRVEYDRELARYVVRVTADLQISQPGGGEYCNFYAEGLGDFRPWRSHYNRMLYTDAADNKLKLHYLSLPVFQPGHIRLPDNGLFGVVDEKEGNPVVVLEESTPASCLNVCMCWFDLHMIWDEPWKVSRDDRTKTTFTAAVSGPPYRYHAKYKAYWINATETKEVLAKAQTVSLEPYAKAFSNMLPVKMNEVNEFEHLADFKSGDVKYIYFPLPRKGASLDNTVAHSGTSSMRMEATSDKGLSVATTGPELLVTPGRQVKISAWVKTSNVTGEGFYLESGFSNNGQQIGPKYCSAKLTGTHDWTLLEIPMPVTPEGTQFLGNKRISFVLGGQGTAWVDDFVFAEEDAEKSRVSAR